MDGSLSPIRLPFDTVRLAGRLFLPLAFFYTLGAVAHQGVMLAAVFLARPEGWHAYLGFGVLSLGLLITLAAYIAMLNTAGRALGDRRVEARSPDERERGLLDAVAHTLLPFLVFYSAWNLFRKDLQEFQLLSNELHPQINLESIDVLLNLFNVNVLLVVITFLIFLVKVACERLYAATGRRPFGVANSAFECMWMFFGIISLGQWIGDAVEWLTSRVVWADAMGLADRLPLVREVKQGLEVLSPYFPDIKDGLIMPLVWLAMAAIVYTSFVTDEAALLRGTRAEARVSGLWLRLPGPVRTAAEFFSRGFRDKYVPLANGLRLVLRGGGLFYLTFCLVYAALEALASVAFIGLARLVGPHEILWWQMWEGAVTFPVDLLHEVLRVSLLAVAFDLALRRGAGRAAARGPAPIAPAAAPSTATPAAPPAPAG
ncbi:hypothetical protein Sru01_26310 [Sphaerisporangium rufum]|uniref:Uncharacterized protein n=1 Tax=Sphaerisporangium rufum TaxID=1381558 RepID=A0A919R0R3_9ACTN|nr:hypothetical protein [Sphaerisporangium rufum]GII77649.1 hypothetical protein Sru01_26310 [Sphaerisporangium rufum]